MTSSTPKALCDNDLHFAVGIEDTFVPQLRPGHRSLDEYELTGHYAHWREDIDLAADSGADAIRYGVPWYRIEPAPGVFTWEWLDRVVDHLVAAELTPIVDLMHYGTPLWLDNQFINASYPQRVADYAHAVGTRYADRLTVYTPLNEPNVNAEWCGETAMWPPYLSGADGWVRLAAAVARGIVLTQQAVDAALGGRGTFVHVEAGLRYDVKPNDPAADSVRLRTQRDLLIEDLVCGLVGDDHPLVEYLVAHGVADAQLDWHRVHIARPDIMGVNYYPHLSTGAVTADVGELPPARGYSGVSGLEEVLRRFQERYECPVLLSETSIRADGDAQLQWLDESVTRILELRAGGMPIAGYTWFPLFDLFDWSYRTGDADPTHYLEPLGLAELRKTDQGDLARVTRPAFQHFRELAAAHGAKSLTDAEVTR